MLCEFTQFGKGLATLPAGEWYLPTVDTLLDLLQVAEREGLFSCVRQAEVGQLGP
jgi:hypothetical protein